MTKERYAARLDFTSGLSDQLAHIRWGLEQLRQRPWDVGLFSELRNSVQELVDLSGSFGQDELTEIGTRLDQALLAWRTRGASGPAWAPIAGADAALADFVERLAPATTPAWRVVRAGL
jgi:hypothetical protein